MTKTDAKLCRVRANELLRGSEMRLHLILAALLCMTFWIGIVYLCECTFDIFPWEAWRKNDLFRYAVFQALFYLVDTLVILLFGLPLLFGTAMILQGAAYGKREPLSTMFCAFGSFRAYGRAMTVIFRLLALPLFSLLLMTLLVIAARWLSTIPVIIAATVSCIATLLVTALLCGRDLAVLPLCYRFPSMRVKQIFSLSHTMTAPHLFPLLCFRLHYVPHVLLTVLTLGIYALVDGLPRHAIAMATAINTLSQPHEISQQKG